MFDVRKTFSALINYSSHFELIDTLDTKYKEMCKVSISYNFTSLKLEKLNYNIKRLQNQNYYQSTYNITGSNTQAEYYFFEYRIVFNIEY